MSWLAYWFGNLEGVGVATGTKLIQYFGSIEKIYEASYEELEQCHVLSKDCIEKIVVSREEIQRKENWKKLQERNIHFCSFFGEDEYPQELKKIYPPPMNLYYKGELPKEENLSIAIVGARECTYYGRDMARMFAFRLAEAGVQVISGMARGIDGWAHQGALESGGKTFAVLGNGVEICYPKEHRKLYQSIINRGGILSEYEPWLMAKPQFFPMRNRIISGLSQGILVVEAREKSGSLITADQALEQGKDVFVVPGRIGDKLSEGCNRLIRQGAIPVLSPQDILEHYGYLGKEQKTTGHEKKILQIMGNTPVSLAEISQKMKVSEEELFPLLLQLRKQKKIRECGRNYFVCNEFS